ncbi:hypothetical protein F3Y22_tig00116962pilonHSYRG00618 [Hibiscus syriacus]|uniref:Neprosin PEP catalytic domain-containing protein n=1 Tax=Hibiscus syriacus TaxID=106335 RepID=A0A6A2WJ93_HIBSY|nr:hypothetical protein F3Y22_tig00116962pilonHSYRG00618 [Hibiscus syriacus]
MASVKLPTKSDDGGTSSIQSHGSLTKSLCELPCYVHVEGSSLSYGKTNEHKGAVKTIQSEDGDIIDCVDIYKNRLFIILYSRITPSRNGAKHWKHPLEGWHKYGECPEGTIPIVRSQQHKPGWKATFFPRGKQLEVNVGSDHECSANVWKPATFNNEISLAQIWVFSGNEMYDCGSWMASKQFEISIHTRYANISRLLPVFEDKHSGNWWLRVMEIDLGYWPGRHLYSKGSGHFPSEGLTKASFIRNIRYVDESGAIKDAENVVPYVKT